MDFIHPQSTLVHGQGVWAMCVQVHVFLGGDLFGFGVLSASRSSGKAAKEACFAPEGCENATSSGQRAWLSCSHLPSGVLSSTGFGKGSLLKSTNQKRMPFFFALATGHLKCSHLPGS